MKRVLTAVVLIPLVLLVIFRAPPPIFLLALGCASYFCVVEFVEIARGHGLRPSKKLLVGFALSLFLLPLFSPFGDRSFEATLSFFMLAALSPSVFLICAGFRSNLRESLPDAAISVFGFLYVGGGLLSVWLLWIASFFGSIFVFCLLLVVWSGDISAYYAGTYMGRRKLAPRISPNKTWEGAIASFVVATALGSAILFNLHPLYDWFGAYHILPSSGSPSSLERWNQHLPNFPVWFALAASAIINIAAQLGDLTESAMKRGANLKDSGAIIPGHGGMLDRVDALLFAAPVAMLLFAIGGRLFSSFV
jgi:phosphatidate cytidylyltransferase